MKSDTELLKAALIASLIVGVTILHYSFTEGRTGLHILHRELFFIPILLASFWFGLKYGLLTAIVVSLVYSPYIFLSPHGDHSMVTLLSQVLVFNLIGFVLGWLTDRQRELQERVLKDEKLAILGEATAIIGHEIADSLKALKRGLQREDAAPLTGSDGDIPLEIERLEKMAEVVSSFSGPDHLQVISNDLNHIVTEVISQYQGKAQRGGVSLRLYLDENKCPSRMDVEKTKRIIGYLVQNALDVSTHGQSIYIYTERGSTFCSIRVRDEGPGIPQENLAKIFSPFFTTKKDGFGLALSSSQHVLRKLGGDIEVEVGSEPGATFVVKVPRDSDSEDIAEAALSASSQLR